MNSDDRPVFLRILYDISILAVVQVLGPVDPTSSPLPPSVYNFLILPVMRFQTFATFVAIPLVSAQLNKLAQDAGKMYFGTATDNGELNNTQYVSILTDTDEFGQLTPSNGMKVPSPFLLQLRFPELERVQAWRG